MDGAKWHIYPANASSLSDLSKLDISCMWKVAVAQQSLAAVRMDEGLLWVASPYSVMWGLGAENR